MEWVWVERVESHYSILWLCGHVSTGRQTEGTETIIANTKHLYVKKIIFCTKTKYTTVVPYV